MMGKLNSREALEKLRSSIKSQGQKGPQKLVSLCAGSGCGAYGTAKVHEVLNRELAAQGLQSKVEVKLTGCHGFCEKGPVMVLHPEGIFYPQVKPDMVPEIVAKTIQGGELVDKFIFKDPATKKK
ncbi:MAG: (2Fe-2S) ferredoxin domain-containing protein, partial [Desulfobacteraceae bacterium]